MSGKHRRPDGVSPIRPGVSIAGRDGTLPARRLFLSFGCSWSLPNRGVQQIDRGGNGPKQLGHGGKGPDGTEVSRMGPIEPTFGGLYSWGGALANLEASGQIDFEVVDRQMGNDEAID